MHENEWYLKVKWYSYENDIRSSIYFLFFRVQSVDHPPEGPDCIVGSL